MSVFSPSGLAVHPNGSRLYVANGFSTTVTVIDTASHTVVTTIPVGSTPARVAVNPAGTRVYVTKPFDDTVAVIDTATNAVVDTVPISTSPTGIAVSSIHVF